MNSNEMIGAVVVAIGGLIAVITPIVKLNSSIVKLNTTLEFINTDLANQKERVTTHGREIEKNQDDIKDLQYTCSDHEKRINKLEKQG